MKIVCLVVAMVGLWGCDDQLVGRIRDPGVAGGGPDGGAGGSAPDDVPTSSELDILLVVDNSRSMADKQRVLGAALDDLVTSLATPRCVDDADVPVAVQPPGPLDACPLGSHRRHRPDLDIHVGVITSSLGDLGADSCPVDVDPDNDGRAHLSARGPGGGDVQTYAGMGFLAWDPRGRLEPPGESDASELATKFADLVEGVGQEGCGYEMPLESAYRFLVDPEPSDHVELDADLAIVHVGTDEVLLQQRASFLRPTSTLLVMLLTDENDCSVRQEGQYHLVLTAKAVSGTNFRMPRARAECATDPEDPCCRSCLADATGCPPDAACADEPFLTAEEDHINLRCFEQKRRFGLDFLYPTGRYVGALTDATVETRGGESVPNPLFAGGRDPRLVILAGIVGVPWQDISRRDEAGAVDVLTGLDAAGEARGGYMTSAELVAAGVWGQLLGDATQPPEDPFMRESIDPRAGMNPATGIATAPPDAEADNPINGHEAANAARADLQFACIFPLDDARDCSLAENVVACDCTEPDNDLPLCAPNPADPSGPTAKTLQVAAKAYPGLRVLDVLRGLGDRGVVTSICPPQVDEPVLPHYGYRPALRAIFERIQPHLAPPDPG